MLSASVNDGAIYSPGLLVRCNMAVANPYMLKGWYPAETEHTWIEGYEGYISFIISRPTEKYTLRLEVLSFSTQELEIFLNGFRVAFFVVDHDCCLQADLPARYFVERRCELVLLCRHALIAREKGIDDDRRLGIALKSWVIE